MYRHSVFSWWLGFVKNTVNCFFSRVIKETVSIKQNCLQAHYIYIYNILPNILLVISKICANKSLPKNKTYWTARWYRHSILTLLPCKVYESVRCVLNKFISFSLWLLKWGELNVQDPALHMGLKWEKYCKNKCPSK